ncbi:spondin domain-containing protein [Microbulbifer sp. 2205BS26-8]|uniref:spondin domain-containing protein n=1 Tax=Microbulbifer sp. 2205BS26-8 TaxID=3064386 RepID=UPI00273F0541|nr:spondin domain-containing protein [Microbulbifer sp. 2205BS26-8]MDP5208719.1 spondin domain-containing protein [Microbulbifer sp. 2205BS26-8]
MKIKPILGALTLAAAATGVHAQTVSVEVTNLTHSIYFTPLLVSAHADAFHLFEIGTAATPALQMMAEGGDISGLVAEAESVGATNVENPAAGLLGPGTSVSLEAFDSGNNGFLSIAAMLLPTNDGFVGLDAWEIPTEPGSYTLYLNAYDAGTEANDERVVAGSGAPFVAGIPANPGGNGGAGGTGVTTEEVNQRVHIHRGNIGDTDPVAGTSDLDARIHRWLNPVAKVVVTIQ